MRLKDKLLISVIQPVHGRVWTQTELGNIDCRMEVDWYLSYTVLYMHLTLGPYLVHTIFLVHSKNRNYVLT